MNKFLITSILVFAIPMLGIAKAKPTPKPSPTSVAVTPDYDAIIDEAENQIDDLTSKLQAALVNLRDTQAALKDADNSLVTANGQAKELQTKIDQETATLNKTVDALNNEIVKYEKAEKALWWYRRIAITIGVAVALYGAFLVLKVLGKIP